VTSIERNFRKANGTLKLAQALLPKKYRAFEVSFHQRSQNAKYGGQRINAKGCRQYRSIHFQQERCSLILVEIEKIGIQDRIKGESKTAVFPACG